MMADKKWQLCANLRLWHTQMTTLTINAMVMPPVVARL